MDYPEDPLTPSLKDSIQSIIRKEQFTTHTIEAEVLAPDGGSFMGVLREVTIRGETKNGEKEIHLFIKTIIPGQRLDIYDFPTAYTKEAYAYKDLFKVFNEIQTEYGVPVAERYKTAKGYDECNTDSIIMENLRKKGFKICDRKKTITLKYAELAIKQLAKFHGLSIVLSEKRANYFVEKIRCLKQPFTYGEPCWNDFIDNLSNLGMSCLEPDVRKRVEKYYPTTYEKYAKYTTDPKSMRCLVHGDYRMNNVMAKFVNGEITEVIPIDYQLLFYGCPIIDFIYFIFGATDQEFRRKYMEHLKNTYHSTMSNFMKYFGMDVEDHYPRKEFERLFKERLDYGLMFTLWCVPIILADEGEVPDVTKVNLAEMKFNLNDTIKTRVRETVNDFIEWGYI